MRGVTYVHAPVFMGPQNAPMSTGIMMVSGERAGHRAADAVLAPMTGKLIDLGERPDAAAAFKLLGNLFLMCLTAGLADMLALGKAIGCPPRRRQLFEHFNPGATIGARFKRMASSAMRRPSWELAMARKDARMLEGKSSAHMSHRCLLPQSLREWTR